MIHFAIPWLLGAGVLGAAVITALHFLSVRRPPELLLPTARFLDEGRVRAVSRSAQPSDLLLLLLRVAALLLASAAFAGPQWVSSSHRVAQLIVVDAAMRTDTIALLQVVGAKQSPDVVTRFVWSDSVDASGAPTGVRAQLSAALPMAVRAATALSAEMLDIDSIKLHVVAPTEANVGVESWRTWRALWPGAVHVSTDVVMSNPRTPVLRFDSVGADDVLRSAFATRLPVLVLHESESDAGRHPRSIVVRRAASATAAPQSETDGSVTIVWPENGMPSGWSAARDTVGAVAANGVALVASWVRTSKPSPESLRGARPIAWWSDGVVAATERAQGEGCVREVGIVLPPSSDILLDANADGLMSALTAPCAGAVFNTITIPEFILADSADVSRGGAAPAAHFRASDQAGVRSTPRWLASAFLIVALLLLLAEWFTRDRGNDAGELRERDASAGARA